MNYQQMIENQRVYYQSDITKSYQFRLNALKKLKEAIIKHQDDILDGLKKDQKLSNRVSRAIDKLLEYKDQVKLLQNVFLIHLHVHTHHIN